MSIEGTDFAEWEIIVWFVALVAACLIVPPCMAVLVDRASSSHVTSPAAQCTPTWSRAGQRGCQRP